MACSLITISTFAFLYGICPTWIPAMSMRILAGFFCITEPLIDGLLREYSEVQMDQYSLVLRASSIVYILGLVSGMLSGTFLSFSDETGVTSASIFEDLPFLLPSLVLSIVGAFAFLLVFIELQDPPVPNAPLIRRPEPAPEEAPKFQPPVKQQAGYEEFPDAAIETEVN